MSQLWADACFRRFMSQLASFSAQEVLLNALSGMVRVQSSEKEVLSETQPGIAIGATVPSFSCNRIRHDHARYGNLWCYVFEVVNNNFLF